jgi:type IV pilus assembly protein PilC
MAVYIYKAVDQDGNQKDGTITAISTDVAISSLQRRGFVISDIHESVEGGGGLNRNISFFEKVTMKDLVITSRQFATLFEAQVSALRIFRLLSEESENPKLGRTLADIAENLQAGNSISDSMAKHPDVFSAFYILGFEFGQLGQNSANILCNSLALFFFSQLSI